MRVMVFVKAAGSTGNAAPPTREAFAAMDRFTEELVAAGIFVAAAGLKNTVDAKRIVIGETGATVADGPFAEGRELVAGFSIWEVRDIAEAVAWARRTPMPGEIEIRPFYEAADMAEYLTPEDLASPRTGDRGRLGVA